MDHLEILDARAALNRAIDRSDAAALAAWARNFGAQLLTIAEDAEGSEHLCLEIED